MSEDFLNALNEEIVSLEEQLADNMLFVRWRELQKVRSLYNLPHATRSGREAAHLPVMATRTLPRRVSPERNRALILVRSLLRGRSNPTPTREILAFLEESRINIPGKDPVNNLSAMLSNSEEFESHGRSGWTLRPEEEEEELFLEEEEDNRTLQEIMDAD